MSIFRQNSYIPFALGIFIAIVSITMQEPKLIKVGLENYAIVDADDFDELSKYNWSLCAKRYAGTTMSGEHVTMHRFVSKAPDGSHVDHKNGSGLDNRKTNLRLATSSQNLANARKQVARADRICTSQYKGVYFRKDRERWSAYIGTGKDRDCLGCFATEEAAAEAYNKAAFERWGEFSKPNIINTNAI